MTQKEKAIKSIQESDEFVLISFTKEGRQILSEITELNQITALLMMSVDIKERVVDGLLNMEMLAREHVKLIEKLEENNEKNN